MTAVHVSREQLTDAHKEILVPNRPVDASLQDRYFVQTPPGLNMFKLLMGFYLIASFLALGIEVFINRGDPTNKTILLVLGIILFAAAMVMDHRHKAAGGNAAHCGAFVLEDGLLIWDGKKASFLAREDIVGFATDAVEGEYKQEYIYPVYRAGDGEETFRDWGFPTVGLTAALHRGILDAWRESGAFSLHDYQYASAQKEE